MIAIREWAAHRWAHRRLNAYVDGELTASRRLRVERHADLCQECGRLLRGLVVVVNGLRALSPPPARPVAAGVIRRLREEDERRMAGPRA